jgi:two-component sensor histidine kinase
MRRIALTARTPESESRSSLSSSGGARGQWGLRRAEVIGILGFWSLFGVLTSVNRLFDSFGPEQHRPLREITFWISQSYLWAAATILVFAVMGAFVARHTRLVARTLGLIAIGVLVVLAMNGTRDLLRDLLLGPSQRKGAATLLQWLFRPWLLNDIVTYTGVVAAGFARVYFLRDRASREETTLLHAHTSHLQAQLAEARLDALRMQINPHFLFNTLHAISSLVERDPRGVRRMIARLSELLRHTLNGAADPEATLEDELDLLGRYLDILQVRFQGKLDVEMEIEPGTRDALVPNLILQPLVENAVKHGVGNLVGNGRISVASRTEGDRLVLQVRDNGPGPGDGPQPVPADGSSGVGLQNVRARLAALYGEEQGFELRAAPDGGAIAEISLPLHTRAEMREGGEAEPEPAGAIHDR